MKIEDMEQLENDIVYMLNETWMHDQNPICEEQTKAFLKKYDIDINQCYDEFEE